jgi:hypothetical protein
MTYTYEYEFDGERVDRWHVPSERIKQLRNRFGSEFTAINAAKKDFANLKQLAAANGREITAVWNYGNGRRVDIGAAQ